MPSKQQSFRRSELTNWCWSLCTI